MKKKLFFTLLSLLFVISLQAADIYVSAAGDNTDGLTPATAFNTIHDAVLAANADDNIIIIGSVTQSVTTTIGKNLTFTGQSNATVEQTGAANLFTVNAAFTISFNNITFQGISNTAAGGVFNVINGANITLTNCQLLNNSAAGANGGGAIFIGANTTVTLTNCLLSGNSATTGVGGAVTVNSSGILNVSGSTFYNNTAVLQGGAIRLISTASATISNSTFYNNAITTDDAFSGAAIRANANTNTVNVTNCLFYNNRGNNGAGSYNDFAGPLAATLNLVNSLAQGTVNLDDQSTSIVNGSDFLSSSNIAWNGTLNKVTYTAPNALSDITPIDFGNDLNDVGAWDSKINIFKGGTIGAIEAWINPANWSNGALPTATDNVAILTGGPCTLDGEFTINDVKVTGRLDIKSNRVLIVNGTSDVTGIVRYSRVLTNDADLLKAWHLVSAPLSGVIFNDDYVVKNDIAINNSNNGIASYNSSDNTWSYLQSAGSLSAIAGQGYSMKITPDGISTGGEFVDNIVTFQGDFNTSDAGVTTPSLSLGFNLLGNPYTSFVSSATFLAANANINQNQIWLWNQANGNYDVMVAGDDFVLAPAQGFFAEVTNTGTVNFAEANQATTGNLFQKSFRTEVKLLINDGTNDRFAKIYYLNNATKGFDFGWEGETFGGIENNVDLFTNLLENNEGKKFQVQSLPVSEMETMVIPVGIKSVSGKEIKFTAEAMNLPGDTKVFLEDRLTNTITRLDEANSSYKVTLNEAANGTGRFYLHTKASGVLSTDDAILESISMYAINKTTLRVAGLSQGKATVKLFNILGKQMMETSFTTAGSQDISLPKLATGLYIIQLETAAGKLNKKIVLE